MARRIVQRVEPPEMQTRTLAWRIEHTTFKKADWVSNVLTGEDLRHTRMSMVIVFKGAPLVYGG